MIDQDDLAAGPNHACAFVEHPLRMLDQGDDELCDDTIERGVGKPQFVGITITSRTCGNALPAMRWRARATIGALRSMPMTSVLES